MRGAAVVDTLRAMPAPSRERVLASILVAALAVLVIPSVAAAHAELDKPTPADKSTVSTPVIQVSGTYTEAIKADGSSLVVKNATGATVAQGGVSATDAKVMTASPPNALPNGAYTVQWTTISAADGDVARGTWTFTVAVVATPASTATPALSASAASTVAPTSTPTAAPAAVPSPSASSSGATSGGGSDVILPIVVALIVLGAGAAYLLSRRGRTTPSA
jgi:copper resistance protein C